MCDDRDDYQNFDSNEPENIDNDCDEMKTAANTGEPALNTNINEKPKLVKHNIDEEMIDTTTHKPLLNEVDE
jgi:hypothetical protein